MPGIDLQKDNKIISQAFEKAPQTKIKPVSVVVLDESGHLKAMQREDGASGGTGDEDEAICAYGIEQAGLKADLAE
jgi:uncharacterized protein GlcG (DUF336 family)